MSFSDFQLMLKRFKENAHRFERLITSNRVGVYRFRKKAFSFTFHIYVGFSNRVFIEYNDHHSGNYLKIFPYSKDLVSNSSFTFFTCSDRHISNPDSNKIKTLDFSFFLSNNKPFYPSCYFIGNLDYHEFLADSKLYSFFDSLLNCFSFSVEESHKIHQNLKHSLSFQDHELLLYSLSFLYDPYNGIRNEDRDRFLLSLESFFFGCHISDYGFFEKELFLFLNKYM